MFASHFVPANFGAPPLRLRAAERARDDAGPHLLGLCESPVSVPAWPCAPNPVLLLLSSPLEQQRGMPRYSHSLLNAAVQGKGEADPNHCAQDLHSTNPDE